MSQPAVQPKNQDSVMNVTGSVQAHEGRDMEDGADRVDRDSCSQSWPWRRSREQQKIKVNGAPRPAAQPDRATVSSTVGQMFEALRERHPQPRPVEVTW